MATTNTPRHREEERFEERARDFGEKASDIATTVGQKAADVASAAGQKAADVAATVGQKAESATAAVGSGMKNLAGAIREKAPESGIVGNVTGAVASTLESGGQYLEEHGLKGMGEDVTNMIRRNPLPALLLAFGLGYLMARATRS